MKRTKKIVTLAMAAVLLVCTTVAATLAYLQSKTEVVTNTFTVGKVEITLDEAKVDLYGNPLKQAVDVDGLPKFDENGEPVYVQHDPENPVERTDASRVTENDYKLLPGHEYVKDPTVTVKEQSEDSYIRILVSVNNISKLTAAFPKEKYSTWYVDDGTSDVFLLQNLVTGWENDVWKYKSYDAATATYEFWYVGEKVNDKDAVPYAEEATKLEPLFETVKIPGELDNTAINELNQTEITIVAHAIQADGFADAAAAWDEWVAATE